VVPRTERSCRRRGVRRTGGRWDHWGLTPRASRQHGRRVSGAVRNRAVTRGPRTRGELGTTRPDLAQGAGDTRDAITQLNEGDHEAAAELFASASDAFERSDSRLSGIVVAPSHLVPVVSQNVRAGADLSAAAASGTAAAAAALRAIDPASLSVVDGAIDLAAIAAVQEPLLQVEAVLNDLDERLTSNKPGLQNALAREEHEHVAVACAGEFVNCVEHGLHLIAAIVGVFFVVRPIGAVTNLNRERPTHDFDDRSRNERAVRIVSRRCGKMLSKSSRVDSRRGDNHLEVGPFRQQLFEVAKNEVDVQAAFVRLVDDQRVIPAQHPITLNLGQQDAVGHHFNQRPLTHLIGEAHGVANVVTKLRSEFVGDALANRPSRHAARLGVANQARDATPCFQAQLRDLSALARTSLTGNDHNLMLSNHLEELVVALGNRERIRVRQSLFGDDRCSCLGASLWISPRPFRSRTVGSRRHERQPGSSSANCHPNDHKHHQVVGTPVEPPAQCDSGVESRSVQRASMNGVTRLTRIAVPIDGRIRQAVARKHA
jgi:hypothetical protein